MNKINCITLAIFIAGCGEAAESENAHVHYEQPTWEFLEDTRFKESGDTSTVVSTCDWEGG